LFYIEKDKELTTELLQKIMNKFATYVQPKLQKWKDYYDGKHNILNKTYSDKTKTCNKIVTNYCKIVTETYAGYICGKPVSYSSNNNISDVQEVINYNDDNAENIAFCTNALIFGVAYELQWLDKYSKTRYSQVNPLNAFAVYDNTLDNNLLYFVRWYDVDSLDDNKEMIVEVYSASSIKRYKTDSIGGSLAFIEEIPHYFGDVPVSVFWLNETTEDNIFNCIVSLNDAYNELQSCEIDDFSAFCDAYLTLAGMDAEKEDIAEMKENRVLILPTGGTAKWLTKNASDTQIVNMLDNIKRNIFNVSSCPNMSDETFLAQSGTALAYKLVGFENVASGIVAKFTKAIQRRIELICNILNLKASDAIWRDIQINFVRNLPVNLTETINLVNSLKGTVSDATLLAQIPFIADVDAELEAIQNQKQNNMALYNFGDNLTDKEDIA
jgi:SPP1 family phage portal protein